MAARIISLFPDQACGRETPINKPGILGRLLYRLRNSLARDVIISFALHLLLILLILGIDLYRSGQAGLNYGYLSDSSWIRAENMEAFKQALQDLLREEKNQEILSEALSKIEKGEHINFPSDYIWFEPTLSKRERIEFFKQIIKKTILDQPEHQLTMPENWSVNETNSRFPEAIKLSSGEKIILKPSIIEGNKYEVLTLKKNIVRELDRMKEAGLIKEKPALPENKNIRLSIGYTEVEIPAEYYYRLSPYEMIMAKGARLFSIVKGFSRLKLPGNLPGDAPDSASAVEIKEKQAERSELAENSDLHGFKVIYYGEISKAEKWAEEANKPGAKKFVLPVEKWPKFLDDLMAYDEETQFRKLEEEFLRDGDPDDPQLAAFVREFINSNLNGAIFRHLSFQAAFDSLEELYYKSPVFDRMIFYINKKPESQLATEFLFCLASALDFERRTINYLKQAYLEASVCLERKYNNEYVFNSQAKALTIKTVYDELNKFLSVSGFRSVDDVLDAYAEEIKKIYYSLMEVGGEGADRARYALGCFLWEQGEKEEAVKIWEKISPAFNTQPFPRIRGLLYYPDFGVAKESINKILDYEASRYTYFLNERAVKFHKWAQRTKNRDTL